MRQECLHSLWISQEAALSCCPIEAPQALLLYPPPPAPTLPPLFFLSHLFFPLLLPVCVQCPGSDFCPAPLGSLYVLSVSLSLQGTVPKAFAARKISLTSEYTTYSRGGGLWTGGATIGPHIWPRGPEQQQTVGVFWRLTPLEKKICHGRCRKPVSATT